jgi:hypothetical protein
MTSSGLEFRAVLKSTKAAVSGCSKDFWISRVRAQGAGAPREQVELDVPCVRDDDVVEGRVPAAEPGQANLENHGGR